MWALCPCAIPMMRCLWTSAKLPRARKTARFCTGMHSLPPWALTMAMWQRWLLQGGRGKVENQNNNTLKTKGYHFEHNFSHGEQFLYSLLATLILLAYLLHTLLDLMDGSFVCFVRSYLRAGVCSMIWRRLRPTCVLIAGSTCSILCWKAGLISRKVESVGRPQSLTLGRLGS